MENITINPVVWYFIAGLISVLGLIVAFFLQKTYSALDKLTLTVDRLNIFMETQVIENKTIKDDVGELWETVDEHTKQITSIDLSLQSIKDAHNYIHNKENNV